MKNIILVTGHYGTGKTNLSINLAVDYRNRGESVTLADLDIVNPYFRSADFRDEAQLRGIEFIASKFANSSLDVPSLNAGLDAKIGGGERLIVDVGGDDAGAFALGRYSPRLSQTGYDMIYVVNAFRYLTRRPEEAILLLKEIEAASRLRATYIVNNSNLSVQTTVEDVERSGEYAKKIAEIAGIPLAFTSVRRDVYEKLGDKGSYRPIDIYVKPPFID